MYDLWVIRVNCDWIQRASLLFLMKFAFNDESSHFGCCLLSAILCMNFDYSWNFIHFGNFRWNHILRNMRAHQQQDPITSCFDLWTCGWISSSTGCDRWRYSRSMNELLTIVTGALENLTSFFTQNEFINPHFRATFARKSHNCSSQIDELLSCDSSAFEWMKLPFDVDAMIF